MASIPYKMEKRKEVSREGSSVSSASSQSMYSQFCDDSLIAAAEIDLPDECLESGSTGYSDFCDDSIIEAAPDSEETLQLGPPAPILEPSISSATGSKGVAPDPVGSVPVSVDTDMPASPHTSKAGEFPEATSAGSPLHTRSASSSSHKRKASDQEDIPPAKKPRVVAKSSAPPQVQHPDDPDCPVVIAHLKYLQPYVKRLPTGVRWEIARAVTHNMMSNSLDVRMLETLRRLDTNAMAVPELWRHLCSVDEDTKNTVFAKTYAKENAAKSPWEELDKEEDMLKDDHYGCLGCNDNHPKLTNTNPDWYGGKVHFTGVLKKTGGELRVTLDAPYLGSSNRFTRRFGSSSFLRIQVHKDLYYDHKSADILPNYFSHPFIIHEEVFRAFFVKDSTVFLFQTNEVWDGQFKTSGVEHMSLGDFLRWHNNLAINLNQTMVKWAARFALGLSNSVPGLRLHAHHIRHEPEIICDAFSGEGKVPTEMEMSDGCGFISRTLLRQLQDRFRWDDEPTAVQCRIAGAKGMLLLHPEHQHVDHSCEVWLRPSQVKIKHCEDALSDRYLQDDADPALITIDVLRSSRMSTPARVSVETIVNFAENGVPPSVFIELMRQSMTQIVTGLTTFEGKDAMAKLWFNVSRAGSVTSQRLSRMAAGAARAKGYVFEDHESDDKKGDDDDGIDTPEDFKQAMQGRSTAWWEDPVSGCPSTLEETVLGLLDSGFVPEACPVLRAKLKAVIDRCIDGYVRRYRVDVVMSCTAFIVPDPCGVLGPNEVHIKSARRNLVDQRGDLTDLILGDVLVTRHPCKVPTDVQKVKAVFHDKLRNYVNVIIVNTNSHFHGDVDLHRHLASMTGGGDYDGDTMEAYWHPEIVDQFRNADPKYAREPELVQQCLDKDKTTVVQFLSKTSRDSEEERMRKIQWYLLGPLRRNTAAIGKYSQMWENASYKYGYSNEKTIFLGYMFCSVLDGIKTGVSVKPEKFEEHIKKYLNYRPPKWKEAMVKSKNDNVKVDKVGIRRNNNLPQFIMDIIHKEFCLESQKQKGVVATLLPVRTQLDEKPDESLAKPWNDAVARAQRMREMTNNSQFEEELGQVKTHVVSVRELWKSRNRTSTKTSFTDLAIEDRQDILRKLSMEFASKPDSQKLTFMSEDEMVRIRASYAYVYDTSQGWSRFPWDLAMRVLCEIKAKATGSAKTVVEDFYMRFAIGKAFANDL